MAVALADGAAESVHESVSRVMMHRHGLEAPQTQQWLRDAHGDWTRVDFLWRRRRTIGEADGMLKYDVDSEALRREKLRQERLEEAGFVVVRWTWDDAWHDGERTCRRIAGAFARGALLTATIGPFER